MFCLKFCAILLYLWPGAWSFIPPAPINRDEPTAKCGYESCHPVKKGYINVHIVPHTHDDVGWLKTVDQYYYGDLNYIQNAGVGYILDSVMDSLRQDKDRRFIFVETSFLWKWWMHQDDTVKHQMQRFVRSGQLEIIGGAWSMNDEATTHYQSIIDQFTWGLRRLNDTFGECGRPKIGWQIDPFGHSREMASIFAQLGYDGLLLGRIDYQDKQHRFDTRTPEFIWKSSASLGEKSKIFTSVMYNTYSPPPGFCFDILCADEPIIDDKRSPRYNVDRRVKAFFDYLANVTKVYTTNHVIITMGEDFNYQSANMWFKNLDKLILYSNQQQKYGSKYNLIYSTPSCYLKAVQESARARNIRWSTKSDDFFPYASDDHSYWTGYFTSRPTLKRFERQGNNFLQVCKQLYALADLGPEDWVDLNTMREAMGVMQHHDAITGTEKQHVAYDYARMLTDGFRECQHVAKTALSTIVTGHKQLLQYKHSLPEINFGSCLLTNVSQCTSTEELDNFVITVYNPLSRVVNHYVKVPVTGTAYEVYDYNGNSIPTQLMPIPSTIMNIPGRKSAATVELIFIAENVPPLGFLAFYVSRIPGDNVVRPIRLNSMSLKSQIRVNPRTGKVDQIRMNDETMVMEQDFYYYQGTIGNNSNSGYRSSGAYIFRPDNSKPRQIAETATYEAYEGEIISELRQIFTNWTSQIVRGYKDEIFLEFDWLIGPIPSEDGFGKEIITRYTTNLRTAKTFYTDANGRETLERVRNYRPTWNVSLSEDVSGNYYPVTSKISMKDKAKNIELAILTDRAHGGTSLVNGQLELMIHRNCLHDDAFGVGEPLNEKAFDKGLVVRGSHYLIAGPASGIAKDQKTVAAQERDIAQRKLLAAWTFISDTKDLSYKDYRAKYDMMYSGLKHSLPANVQILTLEPWKGNTFLLRLEHVFERYEDPVLSQPVTVNLKDLFATFDITWYRETTLGGNQWLSDNKKATTKLNYQQEAQNLQWEVNSWGTVNQQVNSNDIYTVFARANFQKDTRKTDFLVRLEPMQIRTFVVEVQKKSP